MTAPNALPAGYFSAEFQLENPGIFYQFRLRSNHKEPLFAIVKQGSKALASIQKGDRIPMTFHFQDKTIPAQKKTTRIKSIADGAPHGFKNHVLVALEINLEVNTE